MKRVLFLFGGSPRDGKTLAEAVRPLGLSVRTAGRGENTVPLDVLMGLRRPGPLPPPLDIPLAEPMLVMHGLSEEELDGVLEAVRRADVRIDLKAVTTPVNLGWNAIRLYAELCRERGAIRGN